jgi:hypothetical protein
VIADEHPVEVQDTGGAAAEVEAVTTWREALSARLRPADSRIPDEDIFAILNDGGEGQTAAERCAALGVTVPMYCVWKSKYRQLSLDELRDARRREQRRRSTLIGVVVLVAAISTGGAVAGVSWAVLSAFTGSAASPPAPAVTESRVQPTPAAEPIEPRAAATPAAKTETIDPQPQSDAVTTIEESGYRIQVTAADTEPQGRALVARLVAAGYPAYMTRAVVGNKNVFRVRVGPFEALPAAEATAAQLRSAGYAGAWIAR